MKFRLLERNYWGKCDEWRGRKFNYKVEIETPFITRSENYGKYSYTIKTPYNTVYNTYQTKQYFDSLEECTAFVEKWIIEDYKKK